MIQRLPVAVWMATSKEAHTQPVSRCHATPPAAGERLEHASVSTL